MVYIYDINNAKYINMLNSKNFFSYNTEYSFFSTHIIKPIITEIKKNTFVTTVDINIKNAANGNTYTLMLAKLLKIYLIKKFYFLLYFHLYLDH